MQRHRQSARRRQRMLFFIFFTVPFARFRDSSKLLYQKKNCLSTLFPDFHTHFLSFSGDLEKKAKKHSLFLKNML
jgi:hypothetical protein